MSEEEIRPDMAMFLASSVHDMKNSISVMLGSLEKTLAQVDPATFPGYGDIAHMLYETKRINSNLIQLLTVYKLGNHLYPFDPQPQSLADFVRGVVSLNEPLLRSKGVVLELDCDHDLYWEFDEDLVAGVVNHALNNAAHYTRTRIRLVAKEIGRRLELRVEDDGEGYPPRMQADGAAAMSGVDFAGGSTGLGLYFSAMVAKLHRNREGSGEIVLENGGAWGGGCFILRLP